MKAITIQLEFNNNEPVKKIGKAIRGIGINVETGFYDDYCEYNVPITNYGKEIGTATIKSCCKMEEVKSE